MLAQSALTDSSRRNPTAAPITKVRPREKIAFARIEIDVVACSRAPRKNRDPARTAIRCGGLWDNRLKFHVARRLSVPVDEHDLGGFPRAVPRHVVRRLLVAAPSYHHGGGSDVHLYPHPPQSLDSELPGFSFL